VKICNLIHPPANYEPDCYAKMQWFGIRLGDVYVQVQHGHVSHPLDSHRGDPCNHCGFPVPSLLRKRCGAYAARKETGPNTKEYAENGSPERWLGVNARRLSDSRVFVASLQSFVRKDACVSSVSLSQWIDDCLSGW
jgi:hypothetical protein